MTGISFEDSCLLRLNWFALGRRVHSILPAPLPDATMSHVRDFVTGPARAGKGFDEIKETAEIAFGVKGLHKSTIYCII